MKVGAEIPGLSCLVEGTIPPSAGLSSSSGVVMIICFSIEMDKSQVLYLDDFMILAKKWWTWDFTTFAQWLCDLFVSALVVTAALASLWAADRFAIIKRLSDYHIIIIVSMTIKTIFLFLQTGHGSRKAGRTLCSSWTFHWDARRGDGPGGGITKIIMFIVMRMLE